MEPNIGIEPMTYALRERCSTPELIRLITRMMRSLFPVTFRYIFCKKTFQVSVYVTLFYGKYHYE